MTSHLQKKLRILANIGILTMIILSACGVYVAMSKDPIIVTNTTVMPNEKAEQMQRTIEVLSSELIQVKIMNVAQTKILDGMIPSVQELTDTVLTIQKMALANLDRNRDVTIKEQAKSINGIQKMYEDLKNNQELILKVLSIPRIETVIVHTKDTIYLSKPKSKYFQFK